MVPKSQNNWREVSFDDWIPNHRSPHLVYANLNFSGPGFPPGARRLLNFVGEVGTSAWTEDRILRYLKKHQEEFRDCLEWLSKNSVVDYRGRFEGDGVSYSKMDYWEMWDREPEITFLQHHGLDHGGVQLEPASRGEADFEGLKLAQRDSRDPLDPICWYMLTLLTKFGTVFVRRCRYWKCRKFFLPLTARKLFCTDTCRAQQHVLKEIGAEGRKKYLKKRAQYMRKYNAVRKITDNIASKRKRSEKK